jgi:hypothetical protein
MRFLDVAKNFYPKLFVVELLSLEHVDCCFPLEIRSKASHLDVTLSVMGKVSVFNSFHCHV